MPYSKECVFKINCIDSAAVIKYSSGENWNKVSTTHSVFSGDVFYCRYNGSSWYVEKQTNVSEVRFSGCQNPEGEVTSGPSLECN